MLRPHGQAPTWLYSFVDLAFLLLIAFSQVDVDTSALELGEIEVPEVRGEATHSLPDDSRKRVVVRVHPSLEPEGAPFSLLEAGVDNDEAHRIDADELFRELALLRENNLAKPLLAPHERSLTKDMLEAVATVDALWPTHPRTATIAPVSALR